MVDKRGPMLSASLLIREAKCKLQPQWKNISYSFGVANMKRSDQGRPAGSVGGAGDP